jgi:hypothetical protein
MKPRAILFIAGVFTIAIQLTGCVLSIEPVIPDDEAIVDSRLLGTWENAVESDAATLSMDGNAAYAIEYSSSGKKALFGGHVGTIGERQILEVWPTPQKGDVLEPYEGLVIPGRLIFVIEFDADDLHLTPLDVDTLYKAIEAGEVNLGYSGSEGQLILFGNTNQLRAALAPYFRRTGILGERSVWKRVRDN